MRSINRRSRIVLVLCATLPMWSALEPNPASASTPLDICLDKNSDPPMRGNACRKAAQQGHAKAQFRLGLMYRNGRGVPEDYSRAAQWFGKAAEKGHARAQLLLGMMYHQGDGVAQNSLKAAQWYRKAAEQGRASAQTTLGIMYEQGDGVPQDWALAHMWYSLAASNGDKFASAVRNILVRRMTSQQIDKALRLQRQWREQRSKSQ